MGKRRIRLKSNPPLITLYLPYKNAYGNEKKINCEITNDDWSEQNDSLFATDIAMVA